MINGFYLALLMASMKLNMDWWFYLLMFFGWCMDITRDNNSWRLEAKHE